MARIARVVVPDLPYHVIQRGNRRQPTFFCTGDYVLYMNVMSEWCRKCGVDVWAYCLMPNHSHLVAVPRTPDALRRAIGEAHRRYTVEVNRREGWTGYLWQGRFASYPMDDRYTLAAARYVELNPVRAGLASRADEYPWSSARAHLLGLDDGLVSVAPLLSRMPDWSSFIGAAARPELDDELRSHSSTGRPLGTDEFVGNVERILGRVLKPGKGGRPRLPGASDGTEAHKKELVSCPRV